VGQLNFERFRPGRARAARKNPRSIAQLRNFATMQLSSTMQKLKDQPRLNGGMLLASSRHREEVSTQ
jgi:hypothetical protein